MAPLRVTAATQTSPWLQASPSADVLLLDTEATMAKLAPMLRSSYRVATSSHIATARTYLARASVDLIVTDIEFSDGTALDLCREAKTLPKQPTVLLTTEQVERVPEALEAGCVSVLLKPFASNLLFARIGRLLRERSSTLRDRSARIAGKSQHLVERSHLLIQGTNRVWPTTHCAYCSHAGVTSFEFASHRRAWYACLQCKKVWLGKRQE